jgi:hypothetical protein
MSRTMKLSDVPASASFFDVDGVPVVKIGAGQFIAFQTGKPEGQSRDYPNAQKAGTEGDALTRDEFRSWLITGRNKFDRV